MSGEQHQQTDSAGWPKISQGHLRSKTARHDEGRPQAALSLIDPRPGLHAGPVHQARNPAQAGFLVRAHPPIRSLLSLVERAAARPSALTSSRLRGAATRSMAPPRAAKVCSFTPL